MRVIESWTDYGRGYEDGEAKAINRILEIIDTSQTYKMTAGDTDTYIDKRVLREAVEALREGKE